MESILWCWGFIVEQMRYWGFSFIELGTLGEGVDYIKVDNANCKYLNQEKYFQPLSGSTYKKNEKAVLSIDAENIGNHEIKAKMKFTIYKRGLFYEAKPKTSWGKR